MPQNPDKPSVMRRQPRQARSLERVNQILDGAESLFIKDGYNGTTTNAIATAANVSIGSLYQFFPDKSAIVYALAERYNVQLRQILIDIHTQLPRQTLSETMDRLIDEAHQFFRQHPGLYAIFMPLQGALPELAQIEETADNQLIEDLAIFLSTHYPNREVDTYRRIGFILVKAIGNLLWLSLGQSEAAQIELVKEIKRLSLCYLQSYFPDPLSGG